jgi:hypothetical protein
MKSLYSISLTVLAFLIVASPAAAVPNVTVKVAPESSIFANTPATYTVSGEAEVGQKYSVRIMPVESSHPASECVAGRANTKLLHEPIEVHGTSASEAFSYTETIPVEDHSFLGVYAVCAMVREGHAINPETAENTTEFSVVPLTPSNPTPAQPVAPVIHTTSNTSTTKLHAALAKCKKQYKHNKKKRVKCERAAKKLH